MKRKRRFEKKKQNQIRYSKKKKDKIFSRYSGKRIAIVCISFGAILGLLFWFKVTRCSDSACIFHYFPLPEMFIGGFCGLILSMMYWDDKY